MLEEGFKRINFFKGFFTQAEDWQSAQQYHIEKRKIHNRFLHIPGIVYGCLDNLNVIATEDGTALYIGPGYAIDGEGRDLYLPKPEKVSINPQDYIPPATVYVVISDGQEKIDLRPDAANPEHSGHAFIKEWPKVEITTDLPDNRHVIELARIRLSKGATRVKNPEDPDKPGSNQVDLRYIKRAGATTRPVKLEDIGKMIPDEEGIDVDVACSSELDEDIFITIETLSVENADQFYLVNVYPLEEGRVSWHIESVFSKDTVQYRVLIKNLHTKTIKVKVRVYKFC